MDGCDVTRGAGVTLSARSGTGAARGGYVAFRGGFDGIGDRLGRNCPPARPDVDRPQNFDDIQLDGKLRVG
jgi:hypothetical protein